MINRNFKLWVKFWLRFEITDMYIYDFKLYKPLPSITATPEIYFSWSGDLFMITRLTVWLKNNFSYLLKTSIVGSYRFPIHFRLIDFQWVVALDELSQF